MKITNVTSSYDRQAYVKEAGETQRTEGVDNQGAVKNTGVSNQDVIVDISESSRELQVAKDAVAAAPDVRAEKVEALRSAIDNGKYAIDALKIAEKMIGANINELV
jgi:negative regulator of flagellin synthesis FlgM